MAVTLQLPRPLRHLARGATTVRVEGTTAGEVLTMLVAGFPDLRRHLLDPAGHLSDSATLYVDGTDVRYAQGMHTLVPEGATVSLVPIITGG